jgi:DNA-binding winged helix-turn-helix (wHTH) protein
MGFQHARTQRPLHEGSAKIGRRFREGCALAIPCGHSPGTRPEGMLSCVMAAYEVSDLVIDLARQRVTRGAAEIPLPRLSFDLLLVLIRAAPAVLSNDELMAQVWPGVIVSPETVSRRVKLLRDALGDDPRAPRYVAGLRGRGYRLVPEVRSVEKASPRLAPQPSPVQIDAQSTSALQDLSLLRASQGEYAASVMLAERAIACDPANPWSQARHSAYNRYLELGDLTAARDVVGGCSAAGLAPFQVLLYLGDWRAAGEAVYNVPEQLRGAWNHSLAAEAVRDLALHTGEFARAIGFIGSCLDAAASAVPLAHLLQADGQQAESWKLLDDMLRCGHRRVRAGALALQGHRDAAVAELAEAFESGERADWWYTIERDPLWDPLRADARFKAIAAAARTHAAAQRALLEEMRRKGEVPYRSRGLPARRQA